MWAEKMCGEMNVGLNDCGVKGLWWKMNVSLNGCGLKRTWSEINAE